VRPRTVTSGIPDTLTIADWSMGERGQARQPRKLPRSILSPPLGRPPVRRRNQTSTMRQARRCLVNNRRLPTTDSVCRNTPVEGQFLTQAYPKSAYKMFGERPTREDGVPGRIRKRPRQLTRARPSLGRKRPRRGAVLKEPQLPGVRGGLGGQSNRGHVPRTPHQSFSEGPHQVSDITEVGSRNVGPHS
jgi:hypothetical protein